MASNSQQPKGRDGALSALDVVIKTLDLAKESCGILPAQAVFGSASAILTMIRVGLIRFYTMSPPVYICLGLHGKRTGLCRPWNILG